MEALDYEVMINNLLDKDKWPKTPSNTTDFNKQLKEWIGNVCMVVVELNKKVENLESDKNQLKQQIEVLKKENGESANSEINVNNWANVVSKDKKKPVQQLVVVNAAINEQREREKRRKNVVVYGVKELAVSDTENTEKTLEQKEKHDKETVQNILAKIEVKIKPVFVKRMNGKEGRPGPILVGLPEVSDRNPTLLASKKLKEMPEFENVYISPDLTEAERHEDYLLRKKRNDMNDARPPGSSFRYAIRANNIVKLKVLPEKQQQNPIE